MYIRIYDIEDNDKRNKGLFKRLRNRKYRTETSGEYKGLDRNFTSWSDTSRLSNMTAEGLAKYIEYLEFEIDSDGCDEFRQSEYMNYYKWFVNNGGKCELLFIDNEPIENDDLIFLGIDIVTEGFWESMFAIQHYKYDNLNENKLLNTFEEAKEILDSQPYDEIMQKHEMFYVYKYKY